MIRIIVLWIKHHRIINYEPYADILRVLIVEEFAIPTDFEFVVDDSLELGHGFEGSF